MKKLRINYFDGNYAICEDEDGNIDVNTKISTSFR